MVSPQLTLLDAEILQGRFIEETPYLQYCHMEVTLPIDPQKSNEVVFQYKYVLWAFS
jgi:hypothetical protein